MVGGAEEGSEVEEDPTSEGASGAAGEVRIVTYSKIKKKNKKLGHLKNLL